MSGNPGVFTISLDTELAWGTFDVGRVDRYKPAYRRTRSVVDKLCELFDGYDVSATWAMVAHLLEDCDGSHAPDPGPSYPWIDSWYESLPCATGVDKSLWFAPDVLERVCDCGTDQEVGVHGYTHLLLGEEGCDRRTAYREVEAAVAVLDRYGFDPTSFVFPRNRIGHRDVLAAAGFETYRGRDMRWFERRALPALARKPFRFLDEALSTTPPTVVPREVEGLTEIPGSQVFRPYHDGWQFAPHSSRTARAVSGLDRAAARGEVFHLRFHPFDLGFDTDCLLEELEQILSHAATLREDGELVIAPMCDVPSLYSSHES